MVAIVSGVVILPLVFGVLVLLQDAGPWPLLSAFGRISGHEVLF